ncbi:MAG: GntR family transcriptional regulator [Bifidobacterium sp.]|uniref:GntR family transcriptional regulator n=1 Tax=Bifidobacterium fermentum TaxID=3059035 RepID=A0AB39UB53_9BIFI
MSSSARTSMNSQRRFSQQDNVRLLRSLIHEHELLPGERLGSEREISAQLGITRADLRIALASMEKAHEIVRRIGRGGGIVISDERLERNINTVESLPMIARRQGRVLRSKVLSAVIAPASASDTRLLRLQGFAPNQIHNIYNITRLRSIDGSPLSLETSHLPSDMFPGLLNKDLTTSFYRRFEEDYGIHPSDVDETLETIEADARDAELLEVGVGTALVRIRRIACMADGRPFERAIDVYIASRMRFAMHHSGYVRLSATANR